MNHDAAPGDTHSSPRAPQPGAEGLQEPLRSRWSPTLFDLHHELDDAELTQLLHAAQWAPSWGNTQPWHWIVCRRGTASFEHLSATLSRGNAWVNRVSAVLVSVVRVATSDGVEPSPYAHYDTGQAAAHVTLQARAMGLHAHQFAGFDHDEFALRLDVPGTHRVLSGVAVGRLDLGDPAQQPERLVEKDQRPRVRRPLAEQAFEGAWGTPWSGLARTATGAPTSINQQEQG